MILGLAGYATSGKGEVARVLVEERGYTEFTISEPIQAIARKVNPVVGVRHYGHIHAQPTIVRYNDAVEELGYTKAKAEYPELRHFLQRLGVAAREVISDSVWLDAVFKGVEPGAKLVNSSVRFQNEADAIRERGGKVILVLRPGTGPLNDDITEKFAGEVVPDAVINNIGTLKELKVYTLHEYDNLKGDFYGKV